MDFDLSKPQKLLKQTAREFLSRECKPERVRRLMETATAHDEALWQAIADQGWTGLLVPEEFGGIGAGMVELAAVMEEMGRACVPGPFLSTLQAAALIRAAGSEEQKRRWLEPIANGSMKATVANFDGLFVGDAAVSDLIFWVTENGVLPIDRAAAVVEPMPSMDATRKLYRVAFGNAKPDSLPHATRAAIDWATNVATVALCAEMLGGMQWILETTVEYAKTRQQFGRPIGSFQAVQHHCADMLLRVESARSATYYAAWALGENDPAAPLAVSIAKAYCSDAYREVANRGIQVHGGIGFTWEHDLQLYYKRAKSSETLFGDSIFHRERIATLIVDEPSVGAGVPARSATGEAPAATLVKSF